MVKQKNINENETPINALPKYKIRTMKDDLAELGMEELKKEAKEAKKVKEISPPEKLPIVPAPVRFESRIEPKPEIKKPEKIPLPPLPPKPKIVKPAKTKIEIPKLEIIKPLKPELPKPPKPKRVEVPRPEISPAPKPGLKKPKVKTKSKLLPILAIILLALIGIGAFFYWQGTKIEPEPEPKPEPVKPSESLIGVEETKIISLTSEISLFETLKQEIQLAQPDKTFKRIAILKNETEFFSLNEFFKELQVSVPPYALVELKDNYTLVIYSQNNKKHLGLVIEAKNIDNLKQQLRFWEQTMVDDLKNLLLDKNGSQAATIGFQDNVYKDTAIRYINFPEPDLTIDYAIINNLFILSTSKESMYKIIDLLVPSEVESVDNL